MKNKILSTLIILLPLTALAEGGINGGGGGAYVCRNPKGKILESRLVDLWEAENTPFQWPHKTGKLHITYTNKVSAEEQFSAAMKKLATADASLAKEVEEEKNAIFANKNSLDPSISISLPDDLKAGYFPSGCPAEGMMFFNGDSNQLDIKDEIFDKLKTKTDIAAAWAHEAIYKIFREKANHTTSRLTRRLVACLFSDDLECVKKNAIVQIPSDRFNINCHVGANIVATIFPVDPIKQFDLTARQIPMRAVFSSPIFQKDGIAPQVNFNLKNFDTGYMGVENVDLKQTGPLAIYGYLPITNFNMLYGGYPIGSNPNGRIDITIPLLRSQPISLECEKPLEINP